MNRRIFFKLLSFLGVFLLAGGVLGQEKPRIKQSEIQAKASRAADEIIGLAREAAKKRGLTLPEENERKLRETTFIRYLADIRAAGYDVYDP